jgi:hypothetical protein
MTYRVMRAEGGSRRRVPCCRDSGSSWRRCFGAASSELMSFALRHVSPVEGRNPGRNIFAVVGRRTAATAAARAAAGLLKNASVDRKP